MSSAIYALSGDPITYGHIDIIERASKGFDLLIVAIGQNPTKDYTLSDDERLMVAKESVKHLDNVEVMLFDGLLADFAFENKCSFIIRGVRDAKDVSDEQSLALINSSQTSVETVLLFSKSEFVHVSSSSVKALQKEHGDIRKYVPLVVKKVLESKISGQTIIGITGVMGAGKSYVANELVRYAQKLRQSHPNLPVIHNIELDQLAHRVYDLDLPAYKDVREKIISHFGTLDRSEISKIAFGSDPTSNKKHVDFLNRVFKDPIKTLLRKELRGKKGIILINAALLVEQDFLSDCNNHVVVVNASDNVRHERLSTFRGIDSKSSESRVSFMLSNEQKINAISEKIETDRFGKLYNFNNDSDFNENISKLYSEIIKA